VPQKVCDGKTCRNAVPVDVETNRCKNACIFCYFLLHPVAMWLLRNFQHICTYIYIYRHVFIGLYICIYKNMFFNMFLFVTGGVSRIVHQERDAMSVWTSMTTTEQNHVISGVQSYVARHGRSPFDDPSCCIGVQQGPGFRMGTRQDMHGHCCAGVRFESFAFLRSATLCDYIYICAYCSQVAFRR
jgi:hypothetical protein